MVLAGMTGVVGPGGEAIRAAVKVVCLNTRLRVLVERHFRCGSPVDVALPVSAVGVFQHARIGAPTQLHTVNSWVTACLTYWVVKWTFPFIGVCGAVTAGVRGPVRRVRG